MTALPRYRCHKEVSAAKILAIDVKYVNSMWDHALLTLQGQDEPLRVSTHYIEKREPSVGGYYVVYDDGYTSYSPAKAFEEGYTRIDDSEDDAGARVQLPQAPSRDTASSSDSAAPVPPAPGALAAAKARIEALEAALRPFAELKGQWNISTIAPDDRSSCVRPGMIRSARAALSGALPGETPVKHENSPGWWSPEAPVPPATEAQPKDDALHLDEIQAWSLILDPLSAAPAAGATDGEESKQEIFEEGYDRCLADMNAALVREGFREAAKVLRKKLDDTRPMRAERKGGE